MYVVGITGGIAMGKSEAVKVFRGMEIPVWEADEASREVCRPGQAGHQAIRNAYGDAFFAIDGSLERKKPFLREMISTGERLRRFLV